MSLSLAQLLAPSSLDESKQLLIDLLVSLGFSGAASWQSGSLPRTLAIELPARLHSDFTVTIATLAAGGYNDLATGDWLALFSLSHYDNTKQEAVRTRGVVVLTSSAAAPLHVIAAGTVVVADATNGYTYRNVGGGSLGSGVDTLSLLFEAEVAGSNRNVSSDTITVLQTSLVGVTVNNPGTWRATAGGGVEGSDEESDVELRTRNRTKWATRSYATPRAAYENYALEADEVITRVFVDDTNPRGPGTLDIYIAGATGGDDLDPSVATSVEEYLAGDTDDICRIPIGSDPECILATDVAVPITGTIYVSPTYAATVLAAVNAAIDDFFKLVPIGGTQINGVGSLLLSGLYTAVMQVPGVINVAFTAPLASVTLTLGQVAVPDISTPLTVTEVV